MADAQRVIDIVLNGVNQTDAAINGAIRNLDGFSGNVRRATQPFADFNTAALKFEAALLATGVAATVAALAVSSDFSAAAADLQKVLSDTDDLEFYKDLAKETGAAYGVSATEVLQSITNYKQAGFTAQEAGILTKSGLDLVIAGGVEASRAAELLVSSIKGFGSAAGDTGVTVDLLNSVSNEYAVSVDQLLEGFAQFSPIARSAGLSLEETIGVLTPGIEVFRSGSEVANALRTSFLRLQDDSEPVTAALEQIGVSQRDANGELRSARDIYFDVAAAFQNVDDSQKAYLASQLVGIQRSSQFVAVTEGLDQTLRISGEGFEFLGSAAKEVAVQLATAENAANRVGSNFTNLLIDIGSPLEDEFVQLADAISAVFSTLGVSVQDGQLDEIVSFVEANFDRLSQAAETVAQNLPAALEQADLSGFIDGLQAVGEAVGIVFDDIDLSTVDGLARAIEFVGGAFNALGQFSGGVIEEFAPLFDLFSDIAVGAADAGEAFRELGNISGLLQQINLFAGAVGGLTPVLQGLVAVIGLRQGVGLVGNFGSLINVLTVAGGGGVVGALTGLSAVLAAGAGGVALGETLNRLTESLTGASLSTRLVDFLADFNPKLRELNALADDLSSDTILPAVPADQVESLSRAAVAAADIVPAYTAAYQAALGLTPQFSLLGEESLRLANNQRLLNDAAAETAPILFDLGESFAGPSEEALALNDALQNSASTFSVIGSESATAITSLDALKDASAELRTELAVAAIESSGAIRVAQIEADSERAIAAFDNISASVTSTGDVIGDLFGLLGNDNISRFDQLAINQQIRSETEQREELFRLQRRLLSEEARLINARARSLEQGTSTITIQGDGLAPQLEAFMLEMLRYVQVQVAADNGEFLLGQLS
ncbi:MAG: phage tail tape measure protein [Pseudomonadota bacterium]